MIPHECSNNQKCPSLCVSDSTLLALVLDGVVDRVALLVLTFRIFVAGAAVSIVFIATILQWFPRSDLQRGSQAFAKQKHMVGTTPRALSSPHGDWTFNMSAYW